MSNVKYVGSLRTWLHDTRQRHWTSRSIRRPGSTTIVCKMGSRHAGLLPLVSFLSFCLNPARSLLYNSETQLQGGITFPSEFRVFRLNMTNVASSNRPCVKLSDSSLGLDRSEAHGGVRYHEPHSGKTKSHFRRVNCWVSWLRSSTFFKPFGSHSIIRDP